MKLEKAIRNADELRPNVISDAQKYAWLFELEGQFAEMMNVTPPSNESPYLPDKSPESLMPYPKDNVYELYLCAMIDNAQEESALYQNDMVIANTAVDDAKAWYRRHNQPSKHYGVKL